MNVRLPPSGVGLLVLHNLAAGQVKSLGLSADLTNPRGLDKTYRCLRRDGYLDQANQLTEAGFRMVEATMLA
jgi:hypothetical protein